MVFGQYRHFGQKGLGERFARKEVAPQRDRRVAIRFLKHRAKIHQRDMGTESGESSERAPAKAGNVPMLQNVTQLPRWVFR